MRHWLQLATRNWRAKPARSLLATAAVALGVGVVVWVTCCYESVRHGVTETVLEWIGRSHVIIEPVEGVWAVFDEDVEPLVAKVPGVAATTVRTREYIEAAAAPTAGKKTTPDYDLIEISGMIPEKEQVFRTYKLSAGRFLKSSDENSLLVEQLLADEMNIAVGGRMLLRSDKSPSNPREFTVVGIVDRRRASANQAPMVWGRMIDVQTLCKLPKKVKAVDIMLTDPGVANIQHVAGDIRTLLVDRKKNKQAGDHGSESLEVKTTEAQLQKLSAAQGLLQFIMTLLACVVLLTAFFIILASMSMGVTERITELGLLRCVGVTRMQIVSFVFTQTLPLGIAGTLLGIPLGLLLQRITMWAAPQYVGEMAYSTWGFSLGIGAGLGTTLLGAALPAITAFMVSPVHAVRASGNVKPRIWLWLTALTGVILLVIQLGLQRKMGQSASGFNAVAITSIFLLYAGFALLAPLLIALFGRAASIVTANVLRIAPQLLGEEIDKSPFRSAAICSGLMVGLSLIVGLVVWGDSVKQGWQFPKEFPDAMLYSYAPLPLDEVRALRTTSGVAQFTVADDFSFSLSKPSIFRPLRMLDEFSRFLAIDPESGFSIVKLAYLEGTEHEARRKLDAGGHILVTREFANARGKHLGDKIQIWVENKPATFTIAGVVASPGLDIAISFFNATTYFQTYAVGALIGTLDDAQKLFGRRYGKLVLINFDKDSASAPVAPISKPAMPSQEERKKSPRAVSPTGRPTFAFGPGPVPGDGREERIINEMLAKLGYPPKAFVTARELKREIDRNIDRVTLILAVIPFVGLIVSALGLANLMASNVASRFREIAVLRAIGLTRAQLMRMVFGEALVLGILGSIMGAALGVCLGQISNTMTQALSGFAPPLSVPWGITIVAASLAILMCLPAAWIPARHASRSNIVSILGGL